MGALRGDEAHQCHCFHLMPPLIGMGLRLRHVTRAIKPCRRCPAPR